MKIDHDKVKRALEALRALGLNPAERLTITLNGCHEVFRLTSGLQTPEKFTPDIARVEAYVSVAADPLRWARNILENADEEELTP